LQLPRELIPAEVKTNL